LRSGKRSYQRNQRRKDERAEEAKGEGWKRRTTTKKERRRYIKPANVIADAL
jgi:hypothetical protein